jgi:hypothetical protein
VLEKLCPDTWEASDNRENGKLLTLRVIGAYNVSLLIVVFHDKLDNPVIPNVKGF